MLPELPGFPALPLLERRQNLLAAFKARHAHTSWDAAVAALVAFSKVDPAIAGKVYDYYTMQLRPYAKNMALPDANVKAVSDYLLEAGELKSAGPPSKYVDHRFAV